MTLALSRWLGGKRWLTASYPHLLPMPRRGGRGFDCFTGSAVVALHWLAMGVRVVIGDTNPRLIGCLRNLQERPEAVIGTLEAETSAYTDAKDQRADFYARRAQMNRLVPESLESSALFLFMLRAGFNGLWRENSRGECNTTWGDPHNVNKAGQRQHVRMKDLVSADELRAISALLQRADIRLGDFAQTTADARKGDALFADAPYVDPSKAAFVGYSKGGFTLRDRQRLSAWLREMDRRGVRWTATDAATDHTRATYGLWTVDRGRDRRAAVGLLQGKGARQGVGVGDPKLAISGARGGMSKIEVGARVKVAHKPEHDVHYRYSANEIRQARSGQIGEVRDRQSGAHLFWIVRFDDGVDTGFEPDELTPVGAPEYQPSEQIRAITRAAEGLDRAVTVARENAALWRADVDALQAAIQGLTGKGGTVASMVGDLADIARDMAALKAAVEAATGQKRDKVADLVLDLGATIAARIELERREIVARSDAEDATIALAKEQSVRRGAVEARDVLDARLQVSARVASTLRTILRDGDAMAVLRCLDDLDKALRGMPLGETRGRQGERFHAEPSKRPKVALVAGDYDSLEARCDRGEQVGRAYPVGKLWGWFARRAFALPVGADVPTREEAIAAMTRALETWAEIQS